MEQEQTKTGVSRFTLKMIALITMFIDHFGAAVLERALEYPLPFMENHLMAWSLVDIVVRCIGRMAFPLYCMMLVDGFHYTHSRSRYVLRLFLFSLISEVPFDLAFNHAWFDAESNNVFLTLLIGLLVIWGTEEIWKKVRGKKEDNGKTKTPRMGWILLRGFLTALLVAAGMATAEFVLCTDYGAAGVITIFVMYAFSFNRTLAYALGVVVLTAFTFITSGPLEFLAMFMLILVAHYRGQRGVIRINKYFFYGFYPVHILFWVGVAALLGLPIFY